MPSPFPGMDPYLEDPAFWSDFHRRFITCLGDAILDHLPDAYDARIDEMVRVVAPDEKAVRYYPDVAVTGGPTEGTTGATATIDLEPIVMTELEEVRDVWLEVLRRPDRKLVTVIEVLSPSNKVGAGLQDYTARRNEFLHQDVNFVEINLLVGGQRPRIASVWQPSDYYALIARGAQHPQAGVVRWNVRDRLPPIPIPLLAPDADVSLDLQPIFTSAYDRGRYSRFLGYAAPLLASLAPADRTWAAEIAHQIK
jgi:hypothetical protein